MHRQERSSDTSPQARAGGLASVHFESDQADRRVTDNVAFLQQSMLQATNL